MYTFPPLCKTYSIETELYSICTVCSLDSFSWPCGIQFCGGYPKIEQCTCQNPSKSINYTNLPYLSWIGSTTTSSFDVDQDFIAIFQRWFFLAPHPGCFAVDQTQVDQVISAEASAAERMKQMKLTVGIWIWMALRGEMMEHGQDIIYPLVN